MAVTVRVINLDPLIRNLVTSEDMRKTGEKAVEMQRERIAQGLGQRGSKMKRYRKDYAKDRAEAGLPTDKRTLSRTGAMMAARNVIEATKTAVRIGWQNAQKYFYVNQARTPFVKATKAERVELTKFLDGLVRERLRKNLSTARSQKR